MGDQEKGFIFIIYYTFNFENLKLSISFAAGKLIFNETGRASSRNTIIA